MDKPVLTISLLDDDVSVLKAMTRLLRSAGWATQSFEDPLAFFHHATKHPVPVALIDMCIPAMDGLEVQAHLRNLSPGTKVIFLTSRDDPFIRETALAAGAWAFLLKPADGEELLSIIDCAANQIMKTAEHTPASRTRPRSITKG